MKRFMRWPRTAAKFCRAARIFFLHLGDRPIPASVVDVSRISEIKGITVEPDHIRIGGLTTWSSVIAAPLPRCFDALKSAAREIGAIQIQNRGDCSRQSL